MTLGVFSVWLSGIMNGYNKDGLPTIHKYGIMSIVSGVQIVKALGEQTTIPPRPGGLLVSLFVGLPLITGAIFCSGTFLGKSVRHVFPTIKKSLE